MKRFFKVIRRILIFRIKKTFPGDISAISCRRDYVNLKKNYVFTADQELKIEVRLREIEDSILNMVYEGGPPLDDDDLP